MLDKPVYGWCHIKIGNWVERCSDYLDDVPTMLFEALEESCRVRKPTAVEFDAEGYGYIIVFDSVHTYVIYDDDSDDCMIRINIGYDELAKQFVSDMRENLSDWAWWWAGSDEEAEERMKDISVMCDILERRVPKSCENLVRKR